MVSNLNCDFCGLKLVDTAVHQLQHGFPRPVTVKVCNACYYKYEQVTSQYLYDKLKSPHISVVEEAEDVVTTASTQPERMKRALRDLYAGLWTVVKRPTARRKQPESHCGKV